MQMPDRIIYQGDLSTRWVALFCLRRQTMNESLLYPRFFPYFHPRAGRYQCQFRERNQQASFTDCSFGDLDQAMSYVSLVVRFLSFVTEGVVVDSKEKLVRFVCTTPVPFEKAEHHIVREAANPYAQLALDGFDITASRKANARQKKKVEETFARLRQLHDELNAQLYSHPTERPSIQSPQDAYDILRCFLGNLDHEELWVICLDTRNRVMRLVGLYKGSVNSSQIRVGEVFRQAIIDNSPFIIVAHNHPSGDPSPSPEDAAVTKAIVQAGKLLDIELLDHLVVGAERYVSMKERGLGFS
jgi:DNA repair protein RadC